MLTQEYNDAMPKFAEGEQITKEVLDVHLGWLREERLHRADNDAVRKRDQDYYDGITPDDDGGSDEEWVRDIRLNKISPHVDIVAGAMTKRMLYPKVFALSGDKNKNFYALMKLRDLQSRALFTASDFHYHRKAAIIDALTSGDGWVHYGLRPSLAGGVEIFSKYKRWDSILFDSAACLPNGDIQNGKFVCHFSLVELDEFCIHYSTHKDKAEELAKGQNMGDKQPLDPQDGFVDFFPTGNNPAYWGEGGDRQFVIYGVMFFRHPGTRELWKYPFITDRGLTQLYPVAPLSQPYSSHLFPFLRWVSSTYLRSGLPYSPLRHKMGLERYMQYLLRGIAQKIGGKTTIFEAGAIPQAGQGEQQMSIWAYADYLRYESEQPNGVIATAKGGLAMIKMENSSSEAQQLSQLLLTMSGFQSMSGGSPHPSLTGAQGTHSGVALREHLDNALTGHLNLLDTDKAAIRWAGKMNLFFIEDYADKLPLLAFLDEDGETRYLRDEITEQEQRTLVKTRLAVTSIGVAVRSMERKPDIVTEVIPVITEAIKGFAGDRATVGAVTIAALKETNWSSSIVDAMVESFVEAGIRVPDMYLSQKLKERAAQIQKAQQEESEEKDQFAKAGAVADLQKQKADAEKSRAQADDAAAGAVKKLAEAMGVAKESGDIDIDALIKTASQLAEDKKRLERDNRKLMQQNAAPPGTTANPRQGMPPVADAMPGKV